LHQTGKGLTKMGRPRKIKSPMGLDDWLRRMLPEKRPEDRMKIFREWRRLNLRTTLKREPSDQEIADEIEIIRGLDAFNYPFGFGDSLRDFVPEFHKQNRINRAQAAANKRWSKKSEKKSLRDF
jgi:hypothetical protein